MVPAKFLPINRFFRFDFFFLLAIDFHWIFDAISKLILELFNIFLAVDYWLGPILIDIISTTSSNFFLSLFSCNWPRFHCEIFRWGRFWFWWRWSLLIRRFTERIDREMICYRTDPDRKFGKNDGMATYGKATQNQHSSHVWFPFVFSNWLFCPSIIYRSNLLLNPNKAS